MQLFTDGSNSVLEKSAGTSPRHSLIDVAKGMGICLIVIGHNTLFDVYFGLLSDVLASFRTPFFFFISGVTLSLTRRSWRAAVLLRADAWLKPCLVVIVALGLMKIVLGKSSFEGLLTSAIYATGFTYSWPPLWFLPHMWLVYACCFALLIKCQVYLKARWTQAGCFILMTIAGYFWLQLFSSPREAGVCEAQSALTSQLFTCGLPLSADLLLVTSSFFMLGYFFSNNVKNFRGMPGLGMAALLALVALEWIFKLRTDLNHREYNGMLVSPAQALLGIFVMLHVCDALSRWRVAVRVLSYLGRISLFVLIFHSPVVYLITRNGPRLIDSDAVVGTLAFVVPILFSALVHYACQRHRITRALMFPYQRPAGSVVVTQGVGALKG
ncbi:acyltransferase family protein [Pseudomonas sp. UBA4194]|uniref:acyltransferase family protein n=1 Tax=Pseudomonas sp. UBA4194 TaxID=1947317 RepID=UPI0025E91C8F|nr:acyltransferase [Pseudomonas sp. UBA4194]